MIEQIYTYFAVEMIYLWLNIGVLPFWFMLLFFPQAKTCKIFVTSIFPILILATIDLYLIFETYKTGFNYYHLRVTIPLPCQTKKTANILIMDCNTKSL